MAGPNTFTIQTNQRGQAVQLPGLDQLKVGPVATRPQTLSQPGSISYAGAQVAEESVASAYNRQQGSATANWLLKTAGEVVEPYIKAFQNQQVMKGIQEVASGKTMDEIRDEQPWYTKIFGDTDLVTAASAYSAQKRVSDFITNVQQAIPNSANMAPGEFRDFMTQSWGAMQSGNAIDDAVFNQQFLNASEGLFEQWSKQNYKNLQMQAKESQRGAMAGLLTQYGSTMKAAGVDGTVNRDHQLKAQAELLQGLQPVDGQTTEAYYDNLVGAIQESAAAGNFHAVEAINASGMLDKLPVENRVGLTQFIRAQERIKAAEVRITPKYASQMEQLQLEMRTGSIDAAGVLARVQQLNAEASNEYGFTNPIIAPEELENWMGVPGDLVANEVNRQRMEQINAAKQDARQRASLQERVELEARENTIAATRFSSGGLLPSGENMDTVKKVAPQTFDMLEQQQPGAGYKTLVNFYVNNNGTVIPGLQARLKSYMNLADKAEWSPEFDEQVLKPFNTLREQPGGDNAAIAYFGSDNYRKIANYRAAMANGIPQPMAYHEAFVTPERLGDVTNINKADRDSLKSQVNPAWFNRVKATIGLGAAQPGQAAQNRIMQAAQSHYANLKDNARYVDDDEKYEVAVKMAMNDPNLAIYGKWAWDRDSSAKPLHEQVKVQSDQLYGIMHSYLAQQKQFQGMNLDDANFVENYDQGGKSTVYAYVPDGKGSFRVGVIRADDLVKTRDNIIQEQKAERAQMFQEAQQPLQPQRNTGSSFGQNYGKPQ